jgi:hypothetical protein
LGKGRQDGRAGSPNADAKAHVPNALDRDADTMLWDAHRLNQVSAEGKCDADCIKRYLD